MYGSQFPDFTVTEVTTNNEAMFFNALVIISLILFIINGIILIKVLYNIIKNNNKNNILILFLDIGFLIFCKVIPNIAQPRGGQINSNEMINSTTIGYYVIYTTFAIIIPIINIIVLSYTNKDLKNCEEKEEK